MIRSPFPALLAPLLALIGALRTDADDRAEHNGLRIG